MYGESESPAQGAEGVQPSAPAAFLIENQTVFLFVIITENGRKGKENFFETARAADARRVLQVDGTRKGRPVGGPFFMQSFGGVCGGGPAGDGGKKMDNHRGLSPPGSGSFVFFLLQGNCLFKRMDNLRVSFS